MAGAVSADGRACPAILDACFAGLIAFAEIVSTFWWRAFAAVARTAGTGFTFVAFIVSAYDAFPAIDGTGFTRLPLIAVEVTACLLIAGSTFRLVDESDTIIVPQ